MGLLISVLYLSVCVSLCRQKDATTPHQLYQALNHTAQSLLVLQIIGVNKDFSRCSKVGMQNDCGLDIHFTFLQRERKGGNSLIIKNCHFASSLIDQGIPSSSALCLFWDRHSVIILFFSHWFLFLSWQKSVWLTLLRSLELALKNTITWFLWSYFSIRVKTL